MFLFLGVLLATVFAYILRFHYEIIHAFYLSLKIVGPPAYPIIGNGLMFLNNSSAGILKEIHSHIKKYSIIPNVNNNRSFICWTFIFNRELWSYREIDKAVRWFYSSMAWPRIEYCCFRPKRCWGKCYPFIKKNIIFKCKFQTCNFFRKKKIGQVLFTNEELKEKKCWQIAHVLCLHIA